MKARILATSCLAGSLLLTAAPAHAVTLTLAGVFLDHNGNPVPGAYVGVNGSEQVTWTDSAGIFTFTAIRGETLTIMADSNVSSDGGSYLPIGPKADATGVARPGMVYLVEHLPNFITPTILGTDGDDVLIGTDGRDVIFAGAGNDTITGLDGNDVILGGEGDDAVSGVGGADTILAGAGNDTVDGGAGADKIIGGEGADLLRGEGGNDEITDHNYDSQAINRLIGGAGDDSISISTHAWGEYVPRSYLIGGAGNDQIGSPGRAIVRAGDGDDVIGGVLGGGKVYCGDGNDTAYPNGSVLGDEFFSDCEQVIPVA